MTRRTYLRLNRKWDCGIGDHYGVQQIVSDLQIQGVLIPRGLTRLEKVPGLFMYERLERLLHNRKTWESVRCARILRKKLERFLDDSRRTDHNALSARSS